MVQSAISPKAVPALLDGDSTGNVDAFKQAVKQKLVAEVLPIDWSVDDVALTGTIPLPRLSEVFATARLVHRSSLLETAACVLTPYWYFSGSQAPFAPSSWTLRCRSAR